MSYATVGDLERRWRPLVGDERTTAEALLADAAVHIDAECPLPVPAEQADDQALDVRLIVSCNMVKRALAIPGGIGIESTQQGAGPYQETTKYSNPMGDLYLTKADRRLLGCGRQVAYTVPMGWAQ